MSDLANKIYIETTRSGYSPESCPKTVTLGELIEILQDLADDYGEEREVYLRNDAGYTYGHITKNSIVSSEDLDYYDDEEEC